MSHPALSGIPVTGAGPVPGRLRGPGAARWPVPAPAPEPAPESVTEPDPGPRSAEPRSPGAEPVPDPDPDPDSGSGSDSADLPSPEPAVPDPPPVACVQYFAATVSAPAWARRHTADVLERWDARDVEWAACLVVSELVTNVVRHAGRRADGIPAPCGLTLRLGPDELAVEVWDPSPELAPQPPGGRDRPALKESGRGLEIVAALASRPPALHRHPAQGKTIVAVLARASAGTPWETAGRDAS